jgi:outer membrane biogenesis lipoprotein LolB
MRSIFSIGKKGHYILAIALMSLFLIACSGGQNNEANKKLDETRQQTLENINKIKNDLESRIKYVDEELQNASGEAKERLTEARAMLEAQKELLVSELENVKAATLETWNDVVREASESTAAARAKTNEISKNVREMLDSLESN